MPLTPLDLFRTGNAHGPRMDRVRPVDIQIAAVTGVDWVFAGTGGISTFATRGRLSGQWWKLGAGFDYGSLLLVWNDHGGHWLWEPIRDMLLDDFRSALCATHVGFVRV